MRSAPALRPAGDAGAVAAPLHALRAADEALPVAGGPHAVLLPAAAAHAFLLRCAADVTLAASVASVLILEAPDASARPAAESPAPRFPQARAARARARARGCALSAAPRADGC